MTKLSPDGANRVAMPSHTKGPWVYRRIESGDPTERSLVYCHIGPASELVKNRGVAYAGTYGKLPDNCTAGMRQSEAECEANARLIAAAPELLEALRLIMREYENQDLGHRTFRIIAAELASAAIKLAEGG